MKVTLNEGTMEIVAHVNDDLRFHSIVKDVSELEDYWVGNDKYDFNIWLDETNECYSWESYPVRMGITLVTKPIDDGEVEII